MRFPHPELQKICFIAEDQETLLKLMGEDLTPEEAERVRSYCKLGLPPAVTPEALATMFGYNPGFVWSMLKRTNRHYRIFPIPKGKDERLISAPRVGLKLIQRWLNYHWSLAWIPSDSAHGFVSGRSHISAAKMHCNARWVISADIAEFFPSVKADRVRLALQMLGYADDTSLDMLVNLVCLDGALTQGAPTSPILSNIVLSNLDAVLEELATKFGAVYTRYADDIVFSGKNVLPDGLDASIKETIINDGWTLSDRKFNISQSPHRLKVHGLLVHGDEVRLTKGYRNKLRAFRHLMNSGKVLEDDIAKLSGHLVYSDFIDKQRAEGKT
jgi:hypothetical protein